MLVRLVTGCSWEDAERLCGNKVSDTTVRERRDEWIAAGVFETISNEAIFGYDRIIGLDLSDVALDGSLHKSLVAVGERVRIRPIGPSSDGNGRSSPTRSGSLRLDRRRRQPQRLGPSSADARGRRATWANRGDRDHLARPRLRLCGDASPPCRGRIDDAVIAKKRKRGNPAKATKKLPMGLRWPVERTNSWLSNYGQLRRNTDRKTAHRLAQFASRSPCSSPRSSSTGGTAGRRPSHLFAEALM